MGKLGAVLGDQARQRVAAPDLQRLGLGARIELLESVVVLGALIEGFMDHRRVR